MAVLGGMGMPVAIVLHHESLDAFAPGAHTGTFRGNQLAFAAGVFLCIALADLLPEVAFHAHDRFRLTVALFLGIALAWSIGFFEPQHAHEDHHEQHEHSSSISGH